MAAAAILDNFEWPYLRNGSQSTYSAHRAVIFAIAQLSCLISYVGPIKGAHPLEKNLIFICAGVWDLDSYKR